MTDDPKIAAMQAATNFITAIIWSGTDEASVRAAEDSIFALADRWLAWYRDSGPIQAICPTHGEHPHFGATCLDCPLCRPTSGLPS